MLSDHSVFKKSDLVNSPHFELMESAEHHAKELALASDQVVYIYHLVAIVEVAKKVVVKELAKPEEPRTTDVPCQDASFPDSSKDTPVLRRVK